MTFERQYYEQASLWTGRFLGDPNELARFEALLQLLPEGVATLLDVGCGDGSLVNYLQSRNANLRCVACDRSLAAVAAARHHAAALAGSSDALPFPDRTFDVVLACEVLEHLPLPVLSRTCYEISRVSRERVLISVPFRERRIFIKCRWCGSTFPQWLHLQTFDEDDLQNLIPGFGLECSRRVLVKVPLLRQLWQILRARLPLPRSIGTTDLCPVCSYQPPMGSQNRGFGRAALSRILDQSLPLQLPVGRWIVALYRRK